MKTKAKILFTALALAGILAFSSCTVRTISDNTANDVIPTPTAPASTTAVVAPTPASYTPAQLKEYFYEIALGTEFYSQVNKIRKWKEPLTLEVQGTPTTEDLATLNAVSSEVNQITGGQMQIKTVPSGGNSKITFAPLNDLKKYEPKIMPDNWGFFYASWDDRLNITTTNIVIASDQPTQAERNHLIREELTQSLGLMQDSTKYPDSIFYIEWTDTQNYSDLDKAVIAQLYDPAVRAGMTQTDLEKIIK